MSKLYRACCASHSITCTIYFYFHTFSLQAAINDRVQSASVQSVSTDLVGLKRRCIVADVFRGLFVSYQRTVLSFLPVVFVS